MARPKSKGAYTPLAAQYYLDDAILEAGPPAELMWVRILSFLASVPSDGFVTERQLKMVGIGLRDYRKRVVTLQLVGLLSAVDDGYVARSWQKWNRTTAEMNRELAKDRERKASKRKDSGHNSARNPGAVQTDSGSSTEQYRAVQNSTDIQTPASLVSAFEQAWDFWPKKVERKQAFEKFKIAARKIEPHTLATLIENFGGAYAATTERQFVPALGVWLNGERWTDELPQARTTGESKTQRAMSLMDVAQQMQHDRDRKEISA